MKYKFYNLLVAFVIAMSFAATGYAHGGWHGGGGWGHHGGGGGWNNGAYLATGFILGSMMSQSYYNNYYYSSPVRVCGLVGGYYDHYGYWIPRQRACWWQY